MAAGAASGAAAGAGEAVGVAGGVTQGQQMAYSRLIDRWGGRLLQQRMPLTPDAPN